MVAQAKSSSQRSSSQQGVQPQLRQAYKQSSEMLSEYPFSSVMCAFGIGVGIGVVISHLISEDQSAFSASRNQQFANRLYDGVNSMIPSSMCSMIPQGLAQRMGCS